MLGGRGGTVGAWAAASAAVGALVGAALSWAIVPSDGPLAIGCALLAAVVVGAFARAVVERSVGRRLTALVRFVESQASSRDGLSRLPPLGADEIGRMAAAMNELLAAQTDVRVSMIDQGMELARTQRELELAAELADKSHELGQRLAERALLFDLLRASTEKSGMDEVMPSLCERLASSLRLRELAILVRESEAAPSVVAGGEPTRAKD